MHDEIIVYQDEFEPQPEARTPRPIWRWIKKFIILLAVVLLAVAAFILVNVFRATGNPFSFGHLKGESRGRINIMMLGVGDPGHDGANLSDTNIILSIDTRNHQMAVIGIPRDLRVRIPGYGYGKINNAHADGGVPLAKSVYESTFGVPIDYYLKANFTGLKEVVDAVGGVDVKNDYLLYDPEYPCDNNQYKSCGFRLPAGQHHLDGTTALEYVRCRKGTCGDDFGRAQRQQEVMQSIRQHASSAGTLANPIALGRLVAAAGNNIDTDLSVNNLLRLNDLTKQVDKSKTYNIVFSLAPDGFLVSSSTSDLLPAGGNFDNIQSFVQNVFKFGPIWTEHPTVMIENGTTTPGVAAKLQQQLTTDGYNVNVTTVTNALKRDYPSTVIVDYTAGKRPNTLNYLQGLLKVKQVTQPDATIKTPPADIEIILGADYAATVSGSTETSTPSSSTSPGQ